MNDGQEPKLLTALRSTFGRGLVVIVPLVITAWVLNILFSAVDGIISPLFDQILGRHIPGLGFVSMILLILLVGGLSRNLFASTLFRIFERVISTIPLARTIYTAMKDVINAFQPGKKGKSFSEVVMIEYPRPGLMTIGFVTNLVTFSEGKSSNEMLSVYIPNPPNPTSGILLFLPRSSARTLDITVEDGLKLVLSGGIVTSGEISIK